MASSAMPAKVMLITGGSRGIGAATARLAGVRGYAVCLSYLRDRAAAQTVVAAIETAGGRALAVQADVAEEEDIERLFAECVRVLGRLDALVNNAGIVAPRSRVEDLRQERLERVMAINVIGSLLCAGAAIRVMAKSRGGTGGVIINLSSAAARLGSPNEFVDYAASKGAIDTMTIGLAKELAGEGIRVNAVRPGLIDTEIHASAGVPNRVVELQGMVPMQRGGSAEEVAEAILWLASDAASYCTGTIIDVAGGR